MAPAINESPGISRMVQDAEHLAVLETGPDQLSFLRPGAKAARKQETFGVSVHRRSIERQTSPAKKTRMNSPPSRASLQIGNDALISGYEELRGQVLGGYRGPGLAEG